MCGLETQFHPPESLKPIEKFKQERFHWNMAKAPNGERVIAYKGDSLESLGGLLARGLTASFDAIYIDASHEVGWEEPKRRATLTRRSFLLFMPSRSCPTLLYTKHSFSRRPLMQCCRSCSTLHHSTTGLPEILQNFSDFFNYCKYCKYCKYT